MENILEPLIEAPNEAAYTDLLLNIGTYTLCRVLLQYDLPNNSTVEIQTSLPFVIFNISQSSPWLEKDPMVQAINLGCTVFIVDENATQAFLDNYIPIHDESNFRDPIKYSIFTFRSTGSKAMDLVESMQNHAAIQEIANLLLVVPTEDTFELLTHRYVGNVPESLDLLHLDTYFVANGTFQEESHLFPDKTSNLMGKTFRLASFYLLPWVMPRQDDNGIVQYLNQSYTIDGLDGYLLILFCQKLNCTWNLTIDQYWQYGQAFANRTGNGMMGALVERRADFALAAVGAWHQLFQYFSFSIPIQWIGITCLTPRPTLIDYWRIVFMMFSGSVWVVLIITYIVISLLDYYLPSDIGRWSPSGKGLSWSFMNVLSAFLLLPMILRRGRPSEVIISVAFSAFALIVSNVYIGKIHSILAIPIYEPPTDTIIDLAESGLTWNAPHEVWMYLISESDNPHLRQILTKFRVIPIPSLTTTADLGKEAIVMAKLHFGHSMVGPWFSAENIENYRIMSDFLYYEYDTGYATKTWPLLDRFDHLSRWYRDGCLSKFVELMDVFRYMNQRVQISIEHSRDRLPNKLKVMEVDEIEGGLLMLGIGYAVAMAAFVSEHITKAMERKKVVRRLAEKWKVRAMGGEESVVMNDVVQLFKRRDKTIK